MQELMQDLPLRTLVTSQKAPTFTTQMLVFSLCKSDCPYTGASLDLSQKDTGDLAEGTNLYFTNARAQAAVGAADVGLGNVDNTSDADKPVSTAQQTALDAKQDTLVASDYSSLTEDTTTGSQTDITIAAGRSVNDVLVFADGLMKIPTTDYTITGTTLTFTTAPGNGVTVHVRYLPLG